MKIEPMHWDLGLYALIAFCGAWAAILGGDEAAKYVSPPVLFWVRGIIASVGLSATAIKTFRSQSFSDYLKKRGDTEQVAVWQEKQPEKRP